MTFKTLDFKCALITGGGGGIGYAITEWLQSQGKKVIICGRTESKLKEASEKLGGVPYYVLDTGDIASIPESVKKITSEHPELDCIVNNAGVQRPLEVGELEIEEFLEKADNEISINIRGPMHLALNLLPHFKTKPGAVIVNVSSILGFIPFSIINPVYNGTKAWVHFWSMNLRTQIAKTNANIRVVEIAPPAVTTDLHRERKDPNDNQKDKNPAALSVDEFMEEVTTAWTADKEIISAGPGVKITDRWYNEFGSDYTDAEKKY